MVLLRGEVKFAAIDAAAAEANELVAAVTGKIIRILALCLVADAAVDVTMQDDAASPVVLMGPFKDLSVGHLVLPYAVEGWGQTTSGKALDMLLGGATQVTGCLVYAEV